VNKAQLFHIFSEKRDSLNSISWSDLDELVRDYPWFAGGRMLLLAKMKSEDDHRYLNFLRESSPYFFDRRSLKKFLNSFETPTEIQIEFEKESVKKSILKVAAKIESLQNQLETHQKLEDFVADKKDFNEESENKIDQSKENLFVVEEILAQEKEVDVDERPLFSLSDYLIRFQDPEKELPKFEVPKPIIDPLESQILASIPYFSIPGKDEIPDLEPVMPPIIEEDLFEEPVSDTLARIYEAQGQFLLALAVYEKLNLKFPEKNLYFANRMEAIQQKLKS
jgi:hypothetical protein